MGTTATDAQNSCKVAFHTRLHFSCTGDLHWADTVQLPAPFQAAELCPDPAQAAHLTLQERDLHLLLNFKDKLGSQTRVFLLCYQWRKF